MTTTTTTTAPILDQLNDLGAFFNVREEALKTDSGLSVPGKKVLINETDNTPISVVSSRYKTVTNLEVFEAFDKALSTALDIDTTGAYADVKFSHNGARTMVDIVLPAHEIAIDGDKNQLRITTLNSYDGSWRYMTKAGAVRMACMNGQVLGKFAAGYSSTHTPSLDVETSAEQIVKMLTQFESAKGYWETMLSRKTRVSDVKQVIAHFLNIEVDASFDKRPQVKRLMELVKSYEKVMGKTVYSLYNALSDYVTHRDYKADTEAYSRMFQINRFEAVLDHHPVFAE